MSPSGVILLLAVGLCAAHVTQAANPDRHGAALEARARHERGVEELLAHAKDQLLELLRKVQDAARSSVETVWREYEELETQVLESGTEQLFAYGIEVNLTTIASVVKHNIKTCSKTEKIANQGKALLSEYAVCITDDVESLKELIVQMQKLWATAQAMPATMTEVAKQCREHVDGPVDLLSGGELSDDAIHDALASMVGGDPFAVLRDSKSALAGLVDRNLGLASKDIVASVVGDALAEFTDDVDAHDLAAKANELLKQASRVMTKRQLWDFGRATRCVKAVYSLSKSDMVTLPGQMMAAAGNAFKVYQTAQSGITACVSAKVPTSLPAIIALTVDLGVCVAGTNVDEMIAQYPQVAGIKKIIDLAERINRIKKAHASGNVKDLEIDFLPKGVMDMLPPNVKKALAAATEGLAVYNDVKDDFPLMG